MDNLSPFTDSELLERIRSGDHQAFTEVYRKYWYTLFLIAYRRLKDKPLAEELVQELFVVIWTKRYTLQISNLEHYLLRAIKYNVINEIQKQQVHERYTDYCLTKLPQEVIAYQDLSTAIEKGLKTLPDTSRQVFQLNRLEHWPVAQIATHLQLSEKAIGYHLTKSIRLMRVCLKEFIGIK